MSKILNNIISTSIRKNLLALSLIGVFCIACSESEKQPTIIQNPEISKNDNPMVGTWNIRLQEIPDEYTHAITLSKTSWSIIQNGEYNRGPWKVNGDTLILERFTRVHEYVNGQLQIGEKAMKYIITKKETDNFEAIPYFEKDVDSFVTFVFEKE